MQLADPAAVWGMWVENVRHFGAFWDIARKGLASHGLGWSILEKMGGKRASETLGRVAGNNAASVLSGIGV
jgi:hypothetical protein